MTTLSSLSRRLELLEQQQPGQRIFQFPELRTLLKKYEGDGLSEEAAAAKAQEYYNQHYNIPISEKIDRYEAYFNGARPIPEDLRQKFEEFNKIFNEHEQV